MNFTPGEIVFVLFPFADLMGDKRRPGLVLLDVGDNDIVVARITGQAARDSYDLELQEWQQAGLRLPSVVRVHKPTTIEKGLVQRRLGFLSPRDWERVRERIRQTCSRVSR